MEVEETKNNLTVKTETGFGFRFDKDGVTIFDEKPTLEDLKQKTINKLNENVGNLDDYRGEIELLKVILENQKNSIILDGKSIANYTNSTMSNLYAKKDCRK